MAFHDMAFHDMAFHARLTRAGEGLTFGGILAS
jgi:hypothetical protein